jgi:hypothetical protein
VINQTFRLTEKEGDTNLGVKGVLGVVGFGSLASVLEQEEPIEVVLRELHGLDWFRLVCKPEQSPRVWKVRR